LTVRNWSGPNPVRIVIDKQLRLPHTLNLFDGTVKTIVYTEAEIAEANKTEHVQLDSLNFLEELLKDLHIKGIQSVIVEGGSETLRQFISADLWDEARVFTAPIEFGTGIEAPLIVGQLIGSQKLADDDLKIYYRKQV
jgi:diaminohydroxyphosphoribosylaminopyrimidine deaminase / 5-amino-6-(5-phosphoribosylamino)uracil reductase